MLIKHSTSSIHTQCWFKVQITPNLQNLDEFYALSAFRRGTICVNRIKLAPSMYEICLFEQFWSEGGTDSYLG